MVDTGCKSQEVTGDGGHRLEKSGGDGVMVDSGWRSQEVTG